MIGKILDREINQNSKEKRRKKENLFDINHGESEERELKEKKNN